VWANYDPMGVHREPLSAYGRTVTGRAA
jgi:hypothetical protein